MFADLGVEIARQGLIWDVDQPAPGQTDAPDFDDAVARLRAAHIAIEFMVADTPFWAARGSVRRSDPDSYRHAVPTGLYQPVFTDGTDVPGPDKRVNPANPFAAFLGKYVERYRGEVRYYQIWNEPDYPSGDLAAAPGAPNRYFQGSVADYARLLHVGAAVVRAFDPSAEIATGGLGSARYLEALLELGAGRDFDVLDFHAYGGPGSDRALERFMAVAARMRQTLDASGLENMPMACSETGYPGSDPKGQSQYVIKVAAMSAALGLRYLCWYDTTNPSWNDMGLIDWRTMTHPTAAYGAFKEATHWLAGARFLGRMPWSPQAVGLRFVGPRGLFLVAWAPYATTPVTVPLAPGGATLALTQAPVIVPLAR